MEKYKMLVFILLASLLVFLTSCVFPDGNTLCGVCGLAPIMILGFFLVKK